MEKDDNAFTTLDPGAHNPVHSGKRCNKCGKIIK